MILYSWDSIFQFETLVLLTIDNVMIEGLRMVTSTIKGVPTSTDSEEIPLLSGRCLLNNLT